MSLKSGVNLNDEVNQIVETSVNAGMSEQDVAALDKIGKLQDEQLQRSEMTDKANPSRCIRAKTCSVKPAVSV